MGTVPSQSSMHMSMFIMRSAAMKVSRLVISRDPSSVSWGGCGGGWAVGGGRAWFASLV
jgi:hypothetical protein